MKLTGPMIAATALTLAGTTLAAPLVKMEDGTPTPSVVTAWSGKGKKVELALARDADPRAVAAAIEASVDRVRAKVKAGQVLVLGKTVDELLPALAKIDLDGPEDDLTTLAEVSVATDDVDSGSSLRAKKTADLERLLSDRARTAVGKVVSIARVSFPQTEVRVRILRAPSGPLGNVIRKGKTLVFVPQFKQKEGTLDLADAETQTNIGAYFLRKGDRVRIRVGQRRGGRYAAEIITR